MKKLHGAIIGLFVCLFIFIYLKYRNETKPQMVREHYAKLQNANFIDPSAKKKSNSRKIRTKKKEKTVREREFERLYRKLARAESLLAKEAKGCEELMSEILTDEWLELEESFE